MARIGIRGGHTQTSKGAFGYLDEWAEDRILYPLVIKYLREVGNEVFDLTPPENLAFPQEMYNATNRCNTLNLDLFASIHFNSSGGDPVGSEVWVYPGTPSTANMGARITSNMAKLGFPNRGVKTNTGFIDLNSPNCPSMIIETCFVQETDGRRYKNIGADKVARYIANGIDSRVSLDGISIPSQPTPPPIAEQPSAYRREITTTYGVHNGYRWLPVIWNDSRINDYAGVDGTTVEAFKCTVSEGKVIYQLHTPKHGWLPEVYGSNNKYSDYAGVIGTEADGLRMRLEGLDNYDIYYRVKLYGSSSYLPWVKNHEGDGYAGIFNKRIERIQVKVVQR